MKTSALRTRGWRGHGRRCSPWAPRSLAAWLSVISVSFAAHAEPEAAADRRSAELALDVEEGAGGLEAAKIREAIERELEVPTVPATSDSQAVLAIHSAGERRVVMTFRQ